MKKLLLTISMTLALTMLVGAGIANALPAAAPDLTNASTNTNPSNPYEHDSSQANNQYGGAVQTDSNGLPITSGPHGKFASNTNACGRCHQLHRAPSQRLIRFDTSSSANPIYGTCTYCHSFNGQSTYDVKDGMIWDTNDGKRYATNGGGIEKMLVVEGPAAQATVVATTSKHRVNENLVAGNYVKFNAPGNWGTEAANAGKIELRCSSCHQPHGTYNSRQLVTKVDAWDVNGDPTTAITIATQGAPVKIRVNNAFGDERTEYNKKIIDFCVACHADYNSSSAGSASGTFTTKYRHEMGMAPDEGLNNTASNDGTFGYNADKIILPRATIDEADTTKGVVVCTSCHYAHGTFATVTGIKQYDNMYINATTQMNSVGGFEGPKNLRLDNRGVCQNCHNRTKSTVKPKVAKILDPAQNGTANYGTTVLNKYAESFATNTISFRFDNYMWFKTGTKDFGGYAFDIENPANYSIDNGLTITDAKIQPDGRTVVLTTNNPLVATTTYTVTINSGVKDLNWNTIDTTNYTDPTFGSLAGNIVKFTK